jgi:hypothetical protein
MAELARLADDALRVAVRADGGDLVGAGALDRERARANLLALAARHRPRLAAENRLVEGERLARNDVPVGDDLVARLDADEVADDDVLDPDPTRLALANHRRVRRDERGEPVERVLRAQLLDDADRRVGDDDGEEERVLGVPNRERQHAEDDEDPVEEREDVGSDDARRRAARRGRLDRAALGEAAGGLGFAQARVRPAICHTRPWCS